MVVIDSDVIMLEFALHRDARYLANSRFLQLVRGRSPAITVYNLMEILGQLSFNLQPGRLARWPSWQKETYDLTVLWPAPGVDDAATFFCQEIHERPLALLQARHLAFLDALWSSVWPNARQRHLLLSPGMLSTSEAERRCRC